MRRFAVRSAALAAALLLGLATRELLPLGRAPGAAPAAPAPPAAAPATASAAERSGAAALAELRDELSQLAQQVASLQRELRAARPTAQAAARPEPSPQELAAETEQRQQLLTALDAEFAREAHDARWAERTAEQVRSAAAIDEQLSQAVRSVECRTATCRVEIADGSGDTAKVLPFLLQQLSQTLPSATAGPIEYGDGASGTVLYLSRPATASAAGK